MVGKAEGSGAAFDATVKVENNVAALEEALLIAREQEKARFFHNQVDHVEAKIKKIEDQLAGAQESLENARAELKAYEAAQEDGAQ